MITISIMLATVIQALDGTIANVALPHMQGSLSASQDQITWVLTSFIVAAAIATPLTGWLCDRFGQKNVFLVSVAGFTLASVLCGLSATLGEIVAARLLQACSAPRWYRYRRPCCSTSTRAKSTARPWPCGHGRDDRPHPRPHAGRLADRQL